MTIHASHHASLEGANLDFVKKCNAQYTLISTASGKYENVPHPTALKRYKDNTVHDVRRLDVDGSWQWTFLLEGIGTDGTRISYEGV